MTDLSGNPAEQWRLLELKDAQPGDEAWDAYFKGWIILTERRVAELQAIFPNSNKPCRRRIDLTLDPAEPLRRELREAYRLLMVMVNDHVSPKNWADWNEWLARNAAFGAGEEGQ